MDDPQLQERLEQFTPEYQAVILGPEPELLAQSFARSFELSEHDQNVLENFLRFYLMGLLSTDQWVDYIAEFTEFDVSTARMVVEKMQTYIADDIRMQIEELRTGSLLTESEQIETQPPKTSTISQDHTDTEKKEVSQSTVPSTAFADTQQEKANTADQNTLPKVRTMRTDAASQQPESQTNEEKVVPPTPPATTPPPTQDEEPVHTPTSQEELLQKRQQVTRSVPPKPEPVSNTPRWKSETIDE